MSDNRPLLPPLEPGTFRAADGTIRRFSAPRPTSHDRRADGAPERLSTLYQQFYHELDNLDRLTRQFPGAVPGSAPGSAPDTARMASGSDRDLRPRFMRDAEPPNDSLPGSAASPHSPSLPPLRSLGSRARAPLATFATSGPGPRSSRYRPTDLDRYLRHRSRPGAGGAPDEMNRNVHETDAQLRLFLDIAGRPDAAAPRAPPATSPPFYADDTAQGWRPSKRRKRDSDRAVSSFKGFRYGRYGQVEPGQLTMEIMSCDGGLYSDEHSYPPENILKNDNSVYCTKSNRCNIVLRHQGGTVFSLKELVIKAPGSRFSCPIREGMVFVAMESDDLLTRTAQYQIQYLPSRNHRRGTVIFRHEEDGTGVTRIQSRPLRAYSYGADDDDDDDDEDSRTAQIPPEFTASPPPFNVITECSEDESDEDQAAHARPSRRRTPNRIGALPFESDSDDEGIQISFAGGPYRRWPVGSTEEDIARFAAEPSRRGYRAYTARGADSNNRTSSNRGGGGGMTLEEAQEASQIATQEAVRAVGGELMAPLAHFYIEKDKNKCTIRFDPPVSGRFILLKMWSPHQDPQKNIDIQAVVAKGFAGPRYCPAIELA